MSFDDDDEPPETEPQTGESLDEIERLDVETGERPEVDAQPGPSLEDLMSRLADGRGDSQATLGELYDAIAPRLLDYLRERGIGAARRAALARIALREVYRARNSYVDGADVLVWAFAFARQLALKESPVELSPSTEATMLAIRGLHAKQIARIFGVSVAEVRELVAGSQNRMKRALAVGEPPIDENPMEIPVPGYRLLKLLDEGGMGYVFKAEHITLGTTYAIKVMKEHPGKDPAPVQRFINEARMMIDISHDNIVRVYHADLLDDGRAWYAMKLLEGHTLRKQLKADGRLAWSQVAKIVRQICAGLAEVHPGIVHCDIKPENCFVVGRDLEHPDVRLLDFGVARLTRTDGPGRANGGEIHGTSAYMAPEQYRSCQDPRSDIYAIGVMMFEMLTGQLPFAASGTALVVDKQIAPPPPLSGVNGLAFPRGVERIVQRALATDPADRFQSVEELDAAIAALDDSGRGRLPFSRWRQRSARTTLATASVSSLVGCIVTVLLIREPKEVFATIEDGIESVRSELAECRAEHGDPAVPTAAKLKVNGATGEVIGVELVDPGANDDIEKCMVEALSPIRVPLLAEPQREIEGKL